MSIDHILIVLIALDDAGTPTGTASRLFDDLEGDPRNPWLASVFVPVEQRDKGIVSSPHRHRASTSASAVAP
jgi:hypothetical protein